MIRAEVGTIDAYVVRHGAKGLEVLVMHRAHGMRCAGAWEVVHGRIEPGEKPEDAALREVSEETGLGVERLYSIRCVAFYVPREGVVNIAPVFAAFATQPGEVKLGEEHDEAAWLPLGDAASKLAWPSARDALRDIQQLVGAGNAGPLEDVLRVR